MREQRTVMTALLAALWLLLAGCTEDEPAVDGARPFVLTVSQQAWEQSQLSVTRSGETLEALKTSGFGLYDDKFGFSNKPVVWQEAAGAWNYDATWDSENNEWVYGTLTHYWSKALEGYVNLYAYAPYDDASISVTSGILSFTQPNSGDNTTVDLLWAHHENVTPSTSSLTFSHALAKVSLASFTNEMNNDVTLTGVSIKGTFYQSGTLPLNGSDWTTRTGAAEKTITRPYDNPIGKDDTETLSDFFYLIPQEDVVLTFTLSYQELGESKSVEVTKTQTFEKGKNYQLSITLGERHRVVIE